MRILLDHFDKQSKLSLLVRGYITIALIAVIDYTAGSQLSLFVLYFFPIIIIAWFIGRKNGIYIAIVSAFVNLVNDNMFLSSNTIFPSLDLFLLWDFIQNLFMLVIVSFTVSALKESENKKMQYELEVAQQVQSFLLPQTLPSMKTINYYGIRKSFNSVSGDFYDFILIQPHKILIVIGDICGKGMSAALLMAHIHGVLRSNSQIKGNNLSELMQTINLSLHASTEDNKFATLFFGVYDDITQTFTYVNAGHNPPMVFRNGNKLNSAIRQTDKTNNEDYANSLEILRLNTDSLLLGIDPKTTYVAKTEQLYPGDTLFLFTDGIPEARNYLKEHYSEERIAKMISRNGEESPNILCDIIFRDIEKYIGLEPQHDDMTMVIGKIN